MSKIGSIVFVHGRGLLSETIEYFDGGKYSHVFMVLDEETDTILETQYFVNTRVIPNIYNKKHCTVIDLNLTQEQQGKLRKVYFKYLEDKYDWKQIIGLFFHYIFNWNTNVLWNDHKKLICSELMVDLLFSIGYLNETEYKYLIDSTPNILYKALTQKLTNKQAI